MAPVTCIERRSDGSYALESVLDGRCSGAGRSGRGAHGHTFTGAPDGGTIVRDDVTYEVASGRLAHRLVVRRDLERLFEHRAQRLVRLLAA